MDSSEWSPGAEEARRERGQSEIQPEVITHAGMLQALMLRVRRGEFDFTRVDWDWTVDTMALHVEQGTLHGVIASLQAGLEGKVSFPFDAHKGSPEN